MVDLDIGEAPGDHGLAGLTVTVAPSSEQLGTALIMAAKVCPQVRIAEPRDDLFGTALVLISFGAFFTHTLAYSWVSRKAQHAKATATALYLVHYYIGGSLGGFFLLYCWQHAAWHGVVFGGSLIYVILFALCRQLKTYETPRDHISAGSGSLATKPTSEGQPDHCHK
jgi:MFS family permease